VNWSVESSCAMRAPEFWRRLPPTPLARLLSPCASLYGLAAGSRMAREAPRADLPTVIIGGPTIGGDGKTPMALAMAGILRRLGEKPAFLTRGYGRSRGAEREPFRVDLIRHDARAAGDEPLLLARAATTIVCRNRAAGARLATSLGASALILDDGLHSRALEPDLALAVIDSRHGAGNGLCLPAGPLRAPLQKFLEQVDVVVAVGRAAEGPATGALREFRGRPWLPARLAPDAASAARLCGARVYAFAGIARPEKFAASLNEIGAEIVGRRWFPDHYLFAPSEVATLISDAQKLGAIPVTTEKDAMRLTGAARPIEILPVRLAFDDLAKIETLTASALARARIIRGA
jgi:tetraacyldisaccharide 4'-kinase